MAKNNPQYDVFISYRRETGANDARLLQQALKARGYDGNDWGMLLSKLPQFAILKRNIKAFYL